MPKRRKTALADALAPDALATVFARGFIATALLAAVQDRSAAADPGAGRRRVLWRAAQGGAALAAGTVAAEALVRRRYGIALAAAAVGAGAVLAAEQLLNHRPDPDADPRAPNDDLNDDPNDDKETGLGQDIAQEG